MSDDTQAAMRTVLRETRHCGGGDQSEYVAGHRRYLNGKFGSAAENAVFCDVCADLLIAAILRAVRLDAATVERETVERCAVACLARAVRYDGIQDRVGYTAVVAGSSVGAKSCAENIRALPLVYAVPPTEKESDT